MLLIVLIKQFCTLSPHIGTNNIHPRKRGTHLARVLLPIPFTESSPQARDIPGLKDCGDLPFRIIPASAGHTLLVSNCNNDIKRTNQNSPHIQLF